MKVKRQKEDKSKYDKFKVSGTLGKIVKTKYKCPKCESTWECKLLNAEPSCPLCDRGIDKLAILELKDN